MDDLSLPVVLGAGTLAAYLWGRSRNSPPPVGKDLEAFALPPRPTTSGTDAKDGSAARAPLTSLSGRWVWPVGIWQGRKPVISSGWGTPRGDKTHEGVDVMFRRLPSDPYAVGSPNGSKGFVFPDGVMGLAASDGVVWSAGWTSRGFTVVLDHGSMATYYTHLETLLLTPTARGKSGQRVTAGQPLGVVGYDPMDGRKLKHMHFALWRGGPRDAVDPASLMRSWAMVEDPGERAIPSKPSGGWDPKGGR
jgi:murein DD-endopeptidase MepM/ murein hydrolase activator NlpD